MTTKLRAEVKRWTLTDGLAVWHVCAYAKRSTPGLPSTQTIGFRTANRSSHPEAMQAAFELLEALDAELMDETHASRSSRRADREAKLAAEQPHPIITTTEATA